MAILTTVTGYRTPVRIRIVLLCLLFWFSPGFSNNGIAEEKPIQLYEQKIKAGIVYNLLKYTEWPKEAALNQYGKLQICLLGDDPFDGYLAPLEGRTAQQIPITIVQSQNTNQIEQCSVVIIHRDQASNLPVLLPQLNNKNILTVSDIEHFAETGGMIELAKEGEKISLHINTTAISNSKLSIQGPMLKLAKIVSS